jgi:hypothetical protein
VSGRIVTVRVVEIVPVEATRWSNAKTRIEAVNETSGRRITIRSPQRLRQRVDPGCEFCNKAFNRPAGVFACPYCRKSWPATARSSRRSPRRRPGRPETGVFSWVGYWGNLGTGPARGQRARTIVLDDQLGWSCSEIHSFDGVPTKRLKVRDI